MAALYGQESKEVEEAPALIGDTTILQVEHPEFEIRPCGYRAITPCELYVPSPSCHGGATHAHLGLLSYIL